MADAMARVRAELGAEALILNARRVADGVEITATFETEAKSFSIGSSRLTALTWHGVPSGLLETLSHGQLDCAISAAINFSVLPLHPNEQPVMLTGPPGAGKTLTIVRLATRLVMAGTTPVIVTTDGNRAGATEQLSAFTRLLGVQ